MIRSLVSPQVMEDGSEPTVRRNLLLEKLEAEMAERVTMWIDVTDPDHKEIEWLEHNFKLHPTVIADLKTDNGRPSLMIYPNYIFITLFEPTIRKSTVEGREIHCLVGNGAFVTVRRTEAKSIDEAYNRVAQNPSQWRLGAPYFLYIATQYVIDSYYPLLDRVSNQLNTIEENLLTNGTDPKSKQKSVYVIKQQLINLRQMVAPQREVLSRVIGEERIAEQIEMRDLFQHVYERLLRVYDVIDSQRDLSTNVLDMIGSQESNKLVDAVSRLTIFSMIFLPLTFLTSLFDIGFVSTQEPVVLPINGIVILIFVVVGMLFSTIGMLFLFRRRGWL
jgi:magnesium transporter